MEPYYQDQSVTLYHGDCREILPSLPKVDLVLTDPPYPDYHADAYHYRDGLLEVLNILDCRQLVFWSAKAPFPLSYSAIHIWDKCPGGEIAAAAYERIFERNGHAAYKMFRAFVINNPVRAMRSRDFYSGHPSQKPTYLIRQLLAYLCKGTQGSLVVDPFAGVGTTLKTAKDIGLRAIGIEIEERYCEIAANRMSQEVLQFA
jgi:DNA modification methylase